MHLTIPAKLIISLLLGASIGLERESYEYKIDKTKRSGIGSLGVRSYMLITSLGTVAGLSMAHYPAIFLLISILFAVMLAIYYILGSISTKDNGITTELAILWSFLLGVFIAIELFSVNLIIAMTVALILIMSLKKKIQSFVVGIKTSELEGFISYAIIALIILPFLPNTGYTLKDIPLLPDILIALGIDIRQIALVELINPFSVWRIVVIITGVDILGYILERSVGQKRGWLLTSLIGGFISSTSTTQSLAQQSKESKNVNKYVAGALFANFASFIQHFILLASVNALFLIQNIPYIFSLSLSTVFLGLYFLRKKGYREKGKNLRETRDAIKKDRLFTLGPALQFAFLFMFIKIVTKTALVLFGNSGFVVSNIIGAFTGLDAITFNVAELAGKSITYSTGVLTLILANGVNLLSKATFGFVQGNREFAEKFFISILMMIASSFIGLLAIYR